MRQGYSFAGLYAGYVIRFQYNLNYLSGIVVPDTILLFGLKCHQHLPVFIVFKSKGNPNAFYPYF